MAKQKSLFVKEQIKKIAEDRGKAGKVKLLSVNQFGKGTEIWESDTEDGAWIMKFKYSPDAFDTLERARKLYGLLRSRMSGFAISLPSPDIFKIKNFPKKSIRTLSLDTYVFTDNVNECWCSLTRKFEGERLEDIRDTLNKKEIYETLGKIIAEIGKIKFHSFGHLDSKLRVINPSTWEKYLTKKLENNIRILEKSCLEVNLIEKIREKLNNIVYPKATPCCIIDDFNSGSVLLTKHNKYRVSAVVDLDESLAGHPEYGLSRALAYLTSQTDPAFPDYGDEYKFLVKGYEEQAGKLPKGFDERHLLNLFFFNVKWVAQCLTLGLNKERNTRAIEQLL